MFIRLFICHTGHRCIVNFVNWILAESGFESAKTAPWPIGDSITLVGNLSTAAESSDPKDR